MQKKNEFKLHGVMLINKPKGCTSFDVLRALKRKLRTNQVGHTGTLDPMATGVMAVCFGDATKFVQYLTADDKEYLTVVKLGQATNTYDADGEITQEIPLTQAKQLTQAKIKQYLPQMLGKINQTPPMFSAIRVDGKRLYELARKGMTVEVPEREVEVHALELLSFDQAEANDYPTLTLRIHCSKGTYIRSLAVDFAKLFDCPAHLIELQRISAGFYQLSQCSSLEQIPDLSQRNAQEIDGRLANQLPGFIPMVNILSDLPIYLCNAEQQAKLMMGQKIEIACDLSAMQAQWLSLFPQIKASLSSSQPSELKQALIRGINQNGDLIALLKREDQQLQVVKNFQP
jgi:tRNA pseudouridine55 synthase